MQDKMIELCCRINPELPRPSSGRKAASVPEILALLVAFIAAPCGYYLYSL
jgi:hypothetical protein